MRRLFAALAVLAACSLAGCTHSHHAPAPARAGHPCSQSDYFMQCAGRPGLLAPAPTAQPVVAYGVDFAWSCPLPAGARFGASYLSFDASKNWTRGCVNAYHGSGRSTVAVWETAANRATAGYAAGEADARAARSQATALGEPASRPIYFAVDYDTTGRSGQILGYFQGVDHVLGRSHVGGYGGIATIRALFANGLIAYGWQTAAWSAGQWDPRAQLEQYGFTNALDWDRAMSADYGQWPYSAPKPRPKPIAARYEQACQLYAHAKHRKRHHKLSARGYHRAKVARDLLAHDRYGCHLSTGKAFRR